MYCSNKLPLKPVIVFSRSQPKAFVAIKIHLLPKHTNMGITAGTDSSFKQPWARQYLNRFFLFANIVVWVLAFWQTVDEYPMIYNDLRNRVVGARLMKDGLEPYFYIWKSTEPMRYYDTGIDEGGFISVATSTPFWHWAMMPICELPQYQIALLFFVLQWACVVWCVVVARGFAKSITQKQIVALVAGLMMFTLGFRHHFAQMQNYLFIPALLMTAIYLWQKHKGWVNLAAIGCCLAAVVLIRPTFLLLLAPLILYAGWRKPLLSGGVVLACYALFAFANHNQRYNWQQYFTYLKYKTGALQMPPFHSVKSTWVRPESSEGIVFKEPKTEETIASMYDGQLEDSNYMYIHLWAFGKMPSHFLLYCLQIFTLLGGTACALFVWHKKRPDYWYALLFVGFSTYWFFEFFSDVASKLQYYIVIILYVLLLHFALPAKYYKLPLAMIGLGIFFCIFNLPVKMNCTIGQLLMIGGLFTDVWLRNRKTETRKLTAA